MSASYPASIKSFTDIVDGVDYMEAAQVNTAYDEIEAIETFIGATNDTQSYSASLLEGLENYIRGCRLEYKGDADIYVRSGEVMISNGTKYRFRVVTSDTTVDWGDIDTGSEANSTTYYVYLVADAEATTFTVVISTNATTPTGATYFRRIGSFYNNSDGDIDQDSICNDVDSLLGEWETKVNDTVYQANTDGTLYAVGYTTGDATKAEVYTDDSTPPTTLRQKNMASGAGYYSGANCKVRKGDYYKGVVKTPSDRPATSAVVFFIPDKK